MPTVITVNSRDGGRAARYGLTTSGDSDWPTKMLAAADRDSTRLMPVTQPITSSGDAPAMPARPAGKAEDAATLVVRPPMPELSAHTEYTGPLLRQIREAVGVELREIPEKDICCGSAGIWNILNPEPARELGDRKARNVLSTKAQLLVTANPGCLMQTASSITKAGGSIALAHTVEVLDASIRGLSPVDLGVATSSTGR